MLSSPVNTRYLVLWRARSPARDARPVTLSMMPARQISPPIHAPAPARAWHPSKHDTLNQCRFNVGPTSETAAQHLIGIGLTYRVSSVEMLAGADCCQRVTWLPLNWRELFSRIEPETLNLYWMNAEPASQTVGQHWANIVSMSLGSGPCSVWLDCFMRCGGTHAPGQPLQWDICYNTNVRHYGKTLFLKFKKSEQFSII